MVLRSRYKIILPGRTCFVTSSIVNFVNIFTSEKYIKILIDAIKYNQENKNFEVYAYVIMKNHFHMLCSSEKLSNIISSIKSYSAKNIIRQLKDDSKFDILKLFEENKLPFKSDRQYQVWQEGFHPEEILGDNMFYQKLKYIHDNPVKAEYVDDKLKWKYSSAQDYLEGKQGLIKLDLDLYS
jgi:putative transposase